MDLNFNVDLGGVSAGIHTLFIRAKDDNSNWSFLFQEPFLNEAVGSRDAVPDITAIKYFFEQSNVATQTSTLTGFPASTDVDVNFIADLSGLQIGTHNLHLFGLDANGTQSLEYVHEFEVPPTGPRAGIYAVVPSVAYSCSALGIPVVIVNFSSIEIIDQAPNITIILEGSEPEPLVGTMDESSFSAEFSVPGTCSVVKRMTGNFTGTNQLSALYTISFTGPFFCFGNSDCSNQEFSITGVRPNPTPLVFRVERATGDVYADGSFTSGGADLAERINVFEPLEPGDVVELDPSKPGYYRKSRGSSQLIAGVITTRPGFILGNEPEEMEDVNKVTSRPLLALMGRVPVKATTENGPIRPGDLLTISSKAGYAKRCAEAEECEGAIIGKALEGLENGEGLILVLVMSH